MKISVVTISFNQAGFLPKCIESVRDQGYSNYEHIVIDACSNDGTQKVLDQYKKNLKHCVVEKDKGPADGLNKGFGLASGDVFYYLNADDVVLPGAFHSAISHFSNCPGVDVLAGSGHIIDENGRYLRRVWSDPISRLRLGYGGGILIQPSTFIRRVAYESTNGFNIDNRSNWDGELVVDLFLAGANMKSLPEVWSGYRLHNTTITSSANLDNLIARFSQRMRAKLNLKYPPFLKSCLCIYFRCERLVRHPSQFVERIRFGRVYGRSA